MSTDSRKQISLHFYSIDLSLVQGVSTDNTPLHSGDCALTGLFRNLIVVTFSAIIPFNMNVHRQITLKVGPVKVSPFTSSETNAVQAVTTAQASPSLAFDSGPGYESKPLELDLRNLNLPSADTPELDNSLRDLLMENMRSGSTVLNEDNDDAVSEVSTCSSVFALEKENDGELSSSPSLSRQKTSRASSLTGGSKAKTSEGSSYHSSSEAEEEDGRKAAMKKSAKKISDLFTFNSASFSANGASEENDESRPPPGERRRKLSITRRISPLSLHGIFAGNQSVGTNKQEPVSEKPETNKKTRKLSLTMFNKPSSHSSEKERKRRNTDPQLPPNQRVATIIENEEKKNEQDTATERKESQTKPVPEQALFKEEDVKIHDLIKHVLRAHMLSMKEYKRETCDRVCKSICRILKTLVVSMKAKENVPQCKVVCQAYIGSVKEEGLFATVQTLWENEKDNFAAASFRNDSLFGFASVITVALY